MLNPFEYQRDRADETVMPTMFGTVMSGLLHAGGPDVVTVTTAVATRQLPGLEAGVVFWAVTVSVSCPLAGVKAPVKPARGPRCASRGHGRADHVRNGLVQAAGGRSIANRDAVDLAALHAELGGGRDGHRIADDVAERVG